MSKPARQALFTIVEPKRVGFGSPIISIDAYAQSYRDAARELLNGSTTATGALWAFPAVFLYRHAIEIYIKAILIAFGGDVVSKAEVISRQHKLLDQLPDLKRVCAVAGLCVSDELTNLLKEWMEQDPDGVSLRYPEGKVTKGRRGKEFQSPKDKEAPRFERKVFLDGEGFDVKSFADSAESVCDELEELFSDLLSAECSGILRSHGISNSCTTD